MFTRALFCFQVGHDPLPSVGRLQALAPRPERVHVLAHLHAGRTLWSVFERPAPPPDFSLAAIRAGFASWAAEVSGEVVWELDLDAVAEAARGVEAEVVVIGPFGSALPRHLPWVEGAARRWSLPTVWAGGADVGAAPARRRGARRHVACLFERELRPLASTLTFLRAHLAPGDRVTLLGLGEAPPPTTEAAALAELAGLPGEVAWARLDAGLAGFGERLRAWLAEAEVDLLALPGAGRTAWATLALRLFEGDVLGGLGAPLLVQPEEPRAAAVPELWRGRLEACDALRRVDGGLDVLVERVDLFGQVRDLPPDERVALGAVGRPLGVFAHRRGALHVPAAPAPPLPGEPSAPPLPPPTAIGLGRLEGAEAPADFLGAVEATVEVVALDEATPLVLLDAALSPEALAAAARAWPAGAPRRLAVRLDPRQVLSEARARLGGVPLLDASQVLRDGRPGDLPEGIADLRLCRVAAALRAEGAPVLAVVSTGTRRPAGLRFAFVSETELLCREPDEVAAAAQAEPPGEPLLERTGAEAREGNALTLELDNAEARRSLLALIAGARRTIHLQTYIFAEDELTRGLVEALERAARRGVRLRVLVDSLLSLHGSFGQRSALLERLAAAGAQVLAYQPVEGLPRVEDLKLRTHRKLWAIDGEVALVSGRNLAAEYWTGFDEVSIAPTTPWARVPWLDAGALVRGPAVGDVEQAFRRVWLAAGGEPFDVAAPPAAGTSRARLVLHDGLRDARTLEAYLGVIEGARRHVYAVNSFPMQEELQHALARALERGVRVRTLIGNIRPAFGPEAVPFPGGAVRELAAQLVRGRIDGLIELGAEAYELALPHRDPWAPQITPLRPHLHAKLLSADGEVCTVGSANLDVTAAYWESEAVLLIEDPRVARALERRLEALLATSRRVEREDPRWRREAAQRAWLSRNWPSVIG